MYASGVAQEVIDKAKAFHGHWCGGLALGIRAAVWAMEHFGTANDEEIVTVTETDMCGVDAIQALVGCTLGKGNLLFRDTGKIAFTFYRRSDGKRLRIIAKVRGGELKNRIMELRERLGAMDISGEERRKLETELRNLREQDIEYVLSAPFEEIFDIKAPCHPMPPLAQRLPTIICEGCGEGVRGGIRHSGLGTHLPPHLRTIPVESGA